MKIIRGNDTELTITTNLTDYTAYITGYKYRRDLTVKKDVVMIPFDLRCGQYRLNISGKDELDETVYLYTSFEVVESDSESDERLISTRQTVYIPKVSY